MIKLLRGRRKESVRPVDVLDLHEKSFPDRRQEFDLFIGEWSSEIPSFGYGPSNLFDDSRIKWLDKISGGVNGKTVLELGPLEGGHTSMLAALGATVTAIESNRRAFLKCLIVKNAFDFKADFRLGNFTEYMATTSDKYDMILASGVLYHMADPISVMRSMTRLSDEICIWTHYFDKSVIFSSDILRKKFPRAPRYEEIDGKKIALFEYHYLDALKWRGFSGGNQHFSNWLSKDGLFDVLTSLGYSISIGNDDPNHQNGPSILLYATRKK